MLVVKKKTLKGSHEIGEASDRPRLANLLYSLVGFLTELIIKDITYHVLHVPLALML